MKSTRFSRKRYHTSLRFESLETRQLLSAAPALVQTGLAHAVAAPLATTMAASPAAGKILPAPSDLTIHGVKMKSVVLTWKDRSTNEVAFRVQTSIDGTNWWLKKVVAANATTTAVTGLNPSTKYFFRVRAYNKGGLSPFSNKVSVRTLPRPPVAPTNLAASNVKARALDLTWHDNSANEMGFSLDQSFDGTTWTRRCLVEANTTDLALTGLTPHTRYYFRLSAYNISGISPFSNTLVVTTLLA
jgi:hypothetical protein